MGATSEHGDFWHGLNISRDFERLSQGLLFPSWYMITFLNFQKSLSISSHLQKTLSWEGIDPWLICDMPGESTLSVLEEVQLLWDHKWQRP